MKQLVSTVEQILGYNFKNKRLLGRSSDPLLLHRIGIVGEFTEAISGQDEMPLVHRGSVDSQVLRFLQILVCD
ncbi:hypothetical protein Pyn_02933 [Prunus yedoensis var. nudiflora]|uniref:Uncharacterized protein n=1 Tax=Prunus yedoensis var. nudiflora TaxID=2094558 RepID=A0A314UP21_PRUYE|nr:hypothetical protein Pyn_02933 [Prunus yedoensis var. nudiflora]